MKPLTIIIILLLTAASCIKDNGDPLPPETHTGAYTFGCKVDGKVYETSGKPVFEGLGMALFIIQQVQGTAPFISPPFIDSLPTLILL